MSTPAKEGFYWGKWRIAEEGTYDKQPGVSSDEADRPPSNDWEVIHVVEADLDKNLMVMVPGVSQWQAVENFFWGEEVRRPRP